MLTTIIIIAVIAIVYFWWKKQPSKEDDLYEGYVERKQTEAEERQKGLFMLAKGITPDNALNVEVYEWLIETGQQFGRRFEKQEEINRLRKAAGKVAEKIGVSPDEGYQIIRIIYTRCTHEELIDAYRTAKGTC